LEKDINYEFGLKSKKSTPKHIMAKLQKDKANTTTKEVESGEKNIILLTEKNNLSEMYFSSEISKEV
jgi:hypothetical protein